MIAENIKSAIFISLACPIATVLIGVIVKASFTSEAGTIIIVRAPPPTERAVSISSAISIATVLEGAIEKVESTSSAFYRIEYRCI